MSGMSSYPKQSYRIVAFLGDIKRTNPELKNVTNLTLSNGDFFLLQHCILLIEEVNGFAVNPKYDLLSYSTKNNGKHKNHICEDNMVWP